MKRAPWTALCLLLVPASAGAQTAADHAFAQCGTIADANARLACYDTARDQSKAMHWPEFSAPPSAAAQSTAPQDTFARREADRSLTVAVQPDLRRGRIEGRETGCSGVLVGVGFRKNTSDS